MFGKSVTLFRLFGFEVRVDWSWLILALLIVWTLARGYFPAAHPGFAPAIYWWMGVAGALGLFISIVLHELSHSLVARRHNLPIRGITLFIFGGVAHMEDEPADARTELLMAIAGPIASVVLAVVFYALTVGAAAGGIAAPVVTTLSWLAMINLILAAFNLIPAFPLDGGRVLRALLWRWKGDMRRATRTAARVGEGFGILLIVLGAVAVLTGNFITGMWWFLIGMFLRSAAQSSYYQVLVRRALEGEPVRRFMTTTPVIVPPDTSLRHLVEDYIYRYHHELFPVASNGHLEGCVGVAQVKQVPNAEWDRRTVGDVTVPCTPHNTVSPDADAVAALAQMRREKTSRLLVAQDGQVVGIVALKDLLGFLSAKLDLEGAS
jgi:Zn-dependent protease/predicted transcriptional regulator